MPGLSLVLDEQISPTVAVQVRTRCPEIGIVSLSEWREGGLLGQDDARVLRACAAEGLTLVTYDRNTIPPLLAEWGASGLSHGGVIFVDERTVAPRDFGGLAWALAACWDARSGLDWTDRVAYLGPASGGEERGEQ